MRRLLIGLGLAALLAGCGASDATSRPTIIPQAARPTDVPAAAVPATAAPANASGARPTSAPATGNTGAATTKQYDQEPPLTIDPKKQYTATIKLANGDIVIALNAQNAPRTVNSFVFLAREGFYDGVTFHRVLPDFMAQGGDPTGTGTGGPGYEFPNEYDPSLNLAYDKAGVLAMANAGPDTNGSQFFITFGPTPQLTADAYTVFGQVISGQDVLDQITPRDPENEPNAPAGDAIQTITIDEK